MNRIRNSGTPWTAWQIEIMELALFAIQSQCKDQWQRRPTRRELNQLVTLAEQANRQRHRD